jgi:hypothetical protein
VNLLCNHESDAATNFERAYYVYVVVSRVIGMSLARSSCAPVRQLPAAGLPHPLLLSRSEPRGDVDAFEDFVGKITKVLPPGRRGRGQNNLSGLRNMPDEFRTAVPTITYL